jgi:hypothetical protein
MLSRCSRVRQALRVARVGAIFCSWYIHQVSAHPSHRRLLAAGSALAAALSAGCAQEAGATANPPAHAAADASTDSVLDAQLPDSAKPDTGTSCVPKTCTQLMADCGKAPDACGGVVSCGACPAGKNCGGNGPNVCGDNICTPKSCAQAGVSCGPTSDGCGDVLQCGTCPQGSCENGTCTVCSPTTCGALGLACGSAPDGCTDQLQCGDCKGNQSCLSGACGCAGGSHLCGDNCIADGTCCSDGDCSGLLVCASQGAACSCRTNPARVAVYRHVYGKDHMFSTSPDEGAASGYVSEGVKFYFYAPPCQWGLLSLHRLRNVTTSEHLCTSSDYEHDTLVASGNWVHENDIGCISPGPACNSVELYRLEKGWHILSADAAERDALVAAGWNLEATQGHVWQSP